LDVESRASSTYSPNRFTVGSCIQLPNLIRTAHFLNCSLKMEVDSSNLVGEAKPNVKLNDHKRKASSVSSNEEQGAKCTKSIDSHNGNHVDEQKVKLQAGSHPKWDSLNSFKLVKVLKTDAQTKSLVIHAKAKRDVSSAHHAGEDASDADRDWSRNQDDDEPGEDDAILFLEKTPFNTNSTGLAELISADTSLEQVFNNDIYGTYASHPSKAVNCK